jgi:hypothetical protein
VETEKGENMKQKICMILVIVLVFSMAPLSALAADEPIAAASEQGGEQLQGGEQSQGGEQLQGGEQPQDGGQPQDGEQGGEQLQGGEQSQGGEQLQGGEQPQDGGQLQDGEQSQDGEQPQDGEQSQNEKRDKQKKEQEKTNILSFLPLNEEMIKDEHLSLYEFTTDENDKPVTFLRVQPDMESADYPFPESVYALTDAQEEIAVAVSEWTCTEYLPETEGLFFFTPKFPEEYVVSDDAKLPEIIVVVQPLDAARMTTMDATDVIGSVTGKIGPGALMLLASCTEKVLQKNYDETGNETASTILDLLRNNTSENVAEILSIVKGLEQDVARLETEVLNGFNDVRHDMLYTELSGYINEMQTIVNLLKVPWLLYEQAIEEIEVNGGTIQDLNDPAFDGFFKAVDGINFKLCFARLDALFTQTSAVESGVYPAVSGLVKLQYPFEHQNTDVLIATYQMATSLQAQLLTLYGEQAARDGDYSQYNAQVELMAKSFDTQYGWLDFENKSHLAIYGDDESQTLLYPDNPDTVNIQFETQAGTYSAYEVVSNYNGQKYVVLQDPMALKPMIEETEDFIVYEYDYTDFHNQNVRSKDGRYSLVESAGELDGLLGGALGNIPYDQWLKIRGELSFSDMPQVIMINKSGGIGGSEAAQYLLDVTSKATPTSYATNSDYLRWSMKDIYRKNGTVEIGGVKTNKGDAKAVMVYAERTTSATTITPLTAAEFMGITVLTDGQTLDMSKFAGSEMRLSNHTILVTGNVTVIGDPSKTVHGLRFLMFPSEKQPVLKLENVNMVGPAAAANTADKKDIYKSYFGVVEAWTDATLEISGVCNIESGEEHYKLYGVGSVDAALAITGAGTLNVKGMPAVYVPYSSTLTIQQLTLNATTASYMHEYGHDYRVIDSPAIGGITPFGGNMDKTCGYIYINNGASVYAKGKSSKNNNVMDATSFADDIGASSSYLTVGLDGIQTGKTRGGRIENCTLNLNAGRLAETITIGDGVTWAGKMRYKGVLKTMDFDNAGTNNAIYMNIYGDKGVVEGINLHAAIREYDDNAFSKGDKEDFDVYAKDIGKLQYIELYSSGSDDWYGQYMTLSAKKDNYTEKTQFTIYEKLKESMGKRKYFPNAPVQKVTITTASDKNSGTDSLIKMHMLYGESKAATHSYDCSKFIEGNAYQSGTTDVMYVNYSAYEQKFMDVRNIKSIGFEINGDNGWQLKSVKVETIIGENVVETYPADGNPLATDQWLNEKQYYNEFYFEPQESVQYQLEVKTSNKSYAGTDDYIRFAIGDSESNMTSFVWGSHNLSYDGFEQGDKDTFNIVFDKLGCPQSLYQVQS